MALGFRFRKVLGDLVFAFCSNNAKKIHMGLRHLRKGRSNLRPWIRSASLSVGLLLVALIGWMAFSRESIQLQKQPMTGMPLVPMMEVPAWNAATGSRMLSSGTSLCLLPYHFIACSSDDWGRIADSVPLFPDKKARRRFLRTAHHELVQSLRSSAWSFATVETIRDLQRLHSFLFRLQQSAGEPRQRFLLSPMWVVGGPDIPSMQRQLGMSRTNGPESVLHNHAAVPPPKAPTNLADSYRDTPNTAQPQTRNDPGQPVFDKPYWSNRKFPSEEIDSGSDRLSSHAHEKASEEEPTQVILPRSSPQHSALNPKSEWRLRLGHPKMEARASSVLQYRSVFLRRLATNGASLVPGRPLVESLELAEWYWKLWHDRLWSPQFHGGAHIHRQRWIDALQKALFLGQNASNRSNLDASASYRCLREGYVCGERFDALRSEFSTDAWSPQQFLQSIAAFSAFWGYRPRIMSSPHNTWTPALLRYLQESRTFLGMDAGHRQCAQLGLVIESQWPLSCIDREPFDTFGSLFHRYSSSRSQLERKLLEQRAGFTVLAWHAQNAFSATDSEYAAYSRLEHLADFVHFAQRQNHTVFVTNHELHQLRLRGWSYEIWPDALVFRNFLRHDILVPVPCLENVFAEARPWNRARLQVLRQGGRLSTASAIHLAREQIECNPWVGSGAETHFRQLERVGDRVVRQLLRTRTAHLSADRRRSCCSGGEGFLFLPSNSHWVEVRRPWFD
jgi:hypothetical protein